MIEIKESINKKALEFREITETEVNFELLFEDREQAPKRKKPVRKLIRQARL